MIKTKLALMALLLFSSLCMPRLLAESGVKIDINLPLLQIKDEPVMAVIPGTNIYYIEGYDHDFFFYGGYWWRLHDSRWYRAKHYNGPWKQKKKRYVPAPFFKLSPDWRKKTTIHSGIKYKDMKENWKQWDKEKHWEKKQDKMEIKNEKMDKTDDKGKPKNDKKQSNKGRK